MQLGKWGQGMGLADGCGVLMTTGFDEVQQTLDIPGNALNF